jgi:ubiquinone/menaquinone biosynthesis C-methylase UbiE
MAGNERYTLGYDRFAVDFVSRRTLESHGAFFIPHLKPGMQVLDVGCGPGSMTLGIAARIGPATVTGVDMSASQVLIATDRARAFGVNNARFREGSAYDLPFPESSFDAAFSHALLEHLQQPGRAMSEFLRVLKPSGVMGVATPDWSGFLVAPPTPAVQAVVEAYRALQRSNGGNPDVGRSLAQLAVDAGFVNVQQRARYENYAPLSIIGEVIAAQLESAGQPQHAVTLRAWQGIPHGMWAQAWVACVGWKR